MIGPAQCGFSPATVSATTFDVVTQSRMTSALAVAARS
jgi:hypothetical protein